MVVVVVQSPSQDWFSIATVSRYPRTTIKYVASPSDGARGEGRGEYVGGSARILTANST